MNIATEFNEFKEDTLFNKKTTYFIWMIWNYMGKQTKVLIQRHRLLVYSAPTYVWSLNMKSVIYLSDCNWTWTQNYLVRKRTLNHLAKLANGYHLSPLLFIICLNPLPLLCCIYGLDKGGNIKNWKQNL